jgi:hypothetical protein
VNAESWRSALRELSLIVAGVLIALWMNDMHEGRQDRKREHATLQQLLTVTRENEQRAFEAAAGDSFIVGNVLRARQILNAKSQSDSLWFLLKGSFAFSEFSPILGVYDAAAQTGELRLIRNDSLRDRVSRVAGELNSIVAQLRGLDPLEMPVGAATIYDLESRGVSPELNRDAKLTPAQIAILQNDPDLKRALYFLRPYHGRHNILTRRARIALHDLRTVLEVELGVAAVEPRMPKSWVGHR